MCCFPDNQCKNGANTNIDNDCQLLIPELLKIAKNTNQKKCGSIATTYGFPFGPIFFWWWYSDISDKVYTPFPY